MHRYNYHAYMTCDSDFEYIASDDTVTILVAKVGGGTPGEAYDGSWYYRLDMNSETVRHGDDYSTGTPQTHAEVARAIADFVREDFEEDSPVYDALSLFALDD